MRDLQESLSSRTQNLRPNL